VRYNADGSLDAAFGGGGRVVLPGAPDATAVAVQPDGKIVVTLAGARALRLAVDGSVDTTFGTAGFVSHAAAQAFNAVVVQPDGKIVVGGKSTDKHFYVARFDAAGTLDTGFGTSAGYWTNGISDLCGSTTLCEPTESWVTGLALQTDGLTTTGVFVTGPSHD